MNKTSTKKSTDSLNTKTIENRENDFPFEPGDDIVNNILNYSKALSVRKSKNVKHIEVVLN
jgi:hypothetical protein